MLQVKLLCSAAHCTCLRLELDQGLVQARMSRMSLCLGDLLCVIFVRSHSACTMAGVAQPIRSTLLALRGLDPELDHEAKADAGFAMNSYSLTFLPKHLFETKLEVRFQLFVLRFYKGRWSADKAQVL